MKPTDVSITEVRHHFEDYAYRTPIKFAGSAVDRVTLLNVEVTLRSRRGRDAVGFGSMPLGNVWSFPSRVLSYGQTLEAMKLLAAEIGRLTSECDVLAHPIDINRELEPVYFDAAASITRQLALPEPIPPLCTLVTASAFDAAVHDGFGKANGISCYLGYSRDCMSRDLGHYIGPEFSGEYLDGYVGARPRPSLPVYHLVGALDPIVEHDIETPINDGLPETLPDWISADGLTHIKIKLNGDDLGWDIGRVLAVDEAAAAAQRQRGVSEWCYSLDFNERCPNPDYVLEFLDRIRSSSEGAFGRVQYIEQPTARDLAANPSNTMHDVAKLKPVVIDESLVDYESLLLARDLGSSGVALKACKGQSNALLMAAAAQKFGMFVCVQDLTCPGASLLHSAGLAAHIPAVAAIEANARQYVPAANAPWEDRFPSIFRIVNGCMGTGALNGPGLGVVV